ncbi:MAG: zinc ribbon domain-containing protein [Clostridia bacterium]|nr:zinc ribbon domain-containing protein [Clostridia bacterium]
MFCHSCGSQIPDGSTFCASCGSAQQQAAPQAAPQQPYAAPQQPYAAPQAAPQQPYAAPQGANSFNNFMNSLQFHDIMVKFGFFIAAGVFALLGILLFTGMQYGSIMGYPISKGLYAANGFTCVMDILFGILALAFGVAQVFFWAQFKKNNLGFLPMIGTQKTFKFFNLITSVYAGLTAVYFLVQGICVAAAGMSFFAPWLGLVTLLLAVAYYFFTAMYYKNNANKIQ